MRRVRLISSEQKGTRWILYLAVDRKFELTGAKPLAPLKEHTILWLFSLFGALFSRLPF